MNNVVDSMHWIGAVVVSILEAPLQHAFGSWALLIVSLVSGVLFLLVFGKVSNQAAIKRVKRGIHSCILEAILFRHDLKVSLAAQSAALKHAFFYFCLALPPIAVLLLPCILIIAQLALRYESAPLNIGKVAVLTVEVKNAADLQEIRLNTPTGLNAVGPIRIKQESRAAWRLEPQQAGLHQISIEIPSQGYKVEKTISVEIKPKLIASVSYESWLSRLFYPSDINFSQLSSRISFIQVNYPAQTLAFFGIQIHWLVVFVILSMLSGMVAAKFFKIAI